MREGIAIFLILITTTASLKFVDDDMLLFWRRSNSKPCEPFSSHNVECNKCICSADSTLYCTRMFCAKKSLREQNEVSEEDYAV